MPLRPSACVPSPQGHLGPPSPRRPPAGLGLLGLSPLEWGSGPPGAPLGESETQRSRQGLPAPLPQPPQQWRAGLQRPGRPPPGREQVREGAAAGPAAAPPRRAPSPRAAPAPLAPRARPAPALTSFWGRRLVSPSSVQNPPGKAPRAARRRHGKLHFGGSGAGRGLPRPRAGGGDRGAPAPARTRGRRLPPARLSVSVTCPRSPPPPPPPTSRLLPGGGSSRGRVCPEASRQAHQDASGDAHGTPGRSSRPPRRGHGDTGARAGTRWSPDARRPQRRTGSRRAQRHADHKHREGCARDFQTQTQPREW